MQEKSRQDQVRTDDIESPGALDSGGSLRASLTPFAAVLASPAIVESTAPFIPANGG